jgi:hypothetical protein
VPPLDTSDEFMKAFRSYLRMRLSGAEGNAVDDGDKLRAMLLHRFFLLLRDLDGIPGERFDKLMSEMKTMIRSGEPLNPDGT